MTHNIVTADTDALFFQLVDLLQRNGGYGDTAHRLATIVARRQNLTLATVYAMAAAELVA